MTTQFNQKNPWELYPYQGQNQVQQNSGGNAIVSALAKGLAKKNTGNNNHYAKRLLDWASGTNGGTGVATPLTGGVSAGTGIGDTAIQAGMGMTAASTPTTGGLSLDAQAAGNTNPDFSAGGYLDSTGRATDTGFGAEGAGGGLRASDSGQGMTVSDANSAQYSPASEGGTGTATSGGAESSGGSWGSAFTGALSGAGAGVNNYYKDPNMTNQRDGFGTKHPDYRAGVGGGTLGGVLGYFGGPVGSAIAGPVVDWAHPFFEKLTRGLINTGEDMTGDSAGSMLLDPIGTPASGKYSDTQIANDWAKYQPMAGGTWQPWKEKPEALAEDRAKMMLLGGLGRYV